VEESSGQTGDPIWNPGTVVAGAISGAAAAAVVAVPKPTPPKGLFELGLTGSSGFETAIVTVLLGALVGAVAAAILVAAERVAKRAVRAASHK